MPQKPNFNQFRDAIHILTILEDKGYSARLAGGCVRDRLLGIPPKDYDIATDATPPDVTELFESHGHRVVPTGMDHGTVTVLGKFGPVEVTTLRQDVKTDGRRAIVQFGISFEEDAARRDFTINAMFEDRNGKVFDFFQGKKHLQEKRLLFVGSPATRIQEDYLRILRFFRFKARFSMTSTDATLEAIKGNAGGLGRISQERITSELLEILQSPKMAPVLESMIQTGVYQEVFPSLKNHTPIDCRLFDHFDIVPKSYLPIARLATVLSFHPDLPGSSHDLSETVDRLRLSNEQANQVISAVSGLSHLDAGRADQASQFEWIDSLEKKGGRGSFLSFYCPLWSVIFREHPLFTSDKLKQEALDSFIRLEESKGHLRRAILPINAKMLMSELELPSGPALGRILSQLNRDFRNELWSDNSDGLVRARDLLRGKS
jgi:tRNA nucleotidyltransferase/poly(A) polymerase